ncbi:peptidoglycan editing factor PgeF [Alteromonas antoniana]|uniref:peptidoglycan editing factor PgeF n=1 Tax=Alteromonas antoniana TaxID=2803813 RepID=UPI001C477202|nr:peptidoglycan editing factor PgeF [Alteromonas antoniana]
MTSWFSPDWGAPDNVIAYCTTRHGGVSKDHYHGLNVGLHVGDNRQAVEENRAMLPFHERIHWLNQVHGRDVVLLPSDETTADAAISRSSDVFCAVMTADCVPVLLCNADGTEVAAVHAGWKGLANNIIAETISKMASEAGSLYAWIGPAICGEHYEVPADLAVKFDAYTDVSKPATSPQKYFLNLPGIARQQLEQKGVVAVTMSNECTYCKPDTYFSHRFATHQGEHSTGRFVSVIGLR